jgi:hypothetical protein
MRSCCGDREHEQANKPFNPIARENARSGLTAALCGKKMKTVGSAMWLSESNGGLVQLPSAGPQFAASAPSSSQTLCFVLATFESWRVIATATVVDGGARHSSARILRRPSRRRHSSRLSVAAAGNSAISGCCTRRLHRQSVVALHNNSLEPTPVTKARFVWFSSGAAQLSRWAEA